MSQKEVYEVTENDQLVIKQFYQKSEEDIERYVKDLKKWIKTQPHIPQEEDDVLYRMILKLNKFKIEKAKRKLDSFYSIRNIVPDFYIERSPKSDQIQQFVNYGAIITPLPRLFEGQHRLYVIKFLSAEEAGSFDVVALARLLFLTYDLRIHFDSATDEIFICDFQNLCFQHVFRLNPRVVSRMYNVLEKGYSDRIKAVHFINVPSVANILITFIKYIMSLKLTNRIFTHKSLESLQKEISEQYLPAEYGGNLKSLDDYQAKWYEFMESKDEWLIEQGNKRTDEKLRPENSKNPGMFTNFVKMFQKSKNITEI